MAEETKTDIGVQFYKGYYGTGAKVNLPKVSNGAIIFNEDEKVIYVDGVRYGGASSVSFNEQSKVLTIAYADGTASQTLDFSDIATGSSTLEVFSHINGLIGTTVSDDTTKLDYSGTEYLSAKEAAEGQEARTEAASLVEADKRLDKAIDGIQKQINGLDVENVQTVEVTAAGAGDYKDGITLNFKGVTEVDGKIEQGTRTETQKFAKVATSGLGSDVHYDDSTSKMGTEENPIDNVQKAIERLDSRLDDVETIDTFDTVVSTDAATTPAGVKWKSGETEITGTLDASAATMHKIYLVPDTNETAEHTGVYNEYISVRTGKGESATYSWELIGSTKADLTGYVKTIIIGETEYKVTPNTHDIAITAAGVTVTEDEGVDTTMAATSADGLMLGSDVENLAKFTNKRIAEEIAKLDAEVTSDKGDTQTETVKVTITEEDGVLTEVSTNVLGADVKFTAATETAEANLEATKTAGAVLGSDIAAIKSYIDAKAAKGKTTITNSLEAADAIVVTESVNETDGHTNYDVKLVWSEWATKTTETPAPETGKGE